MSTPATVRAAHQHAAAVRPRSAPPADAPAGPASDDAHHPTSAPWKIPGPSAPVSTPPADAAVEPPPPLSAPPAATLEPPRPVSAPPADNWAAGTTGSDASDAAEPARPVTAPPAEPDPAATVGPDAVSTSTGPDSAPPAGTPEQSARPVPEVPSPVADAPSGEPESAPPRVDTDEKPVHPVSAPPAPTGAGPTAPEASTPPAAASEQSAGLDPTPPVAAATTEAAPDPDPADTATPPADTATPPVDVTAPPVAETEPAPGDRPATTAPETTTTAPDEPPADPEQVLAAYRWRLDPETLREVVDDADELRTLRRRLTEKLGASLDNRARARLLSLRAVVSRVVHDLDDALADGRLALTYAEATGELRRTALARARLAEVLRWKGEFAEADRLFAEANSAELPDRLRAALHEHAGRSCHDQGRLMEACEHFERALNLRRADDPELTERIRVCLDAVHTRAAARGGFGPYPRSREEVLRGRRSPVPTLDGGLGRWGYADADGELVLDYRYAEAQPFREGLAWVRRPDAPGWELIDEAGSTLIGPSYAAVRAFSDGLAWVSRGGEADWMAIDSEDTVVVPAGFEDARPFTAGIAAVRRGGWGAVDRNGRLVVPTRYHGFRTALADGRRLDGFTDEGLAVVELGGFRGVVDRTGRVLVAPAHPDLVIHPVAFLANDRTGRWGALDRRGKPLIDPVHPGPDAVLAEIDLLLTDAHPVL
ncbi:WG repeat-containing protein [Micromonospora sp. U56]|nr:WG repeat-containing protein [Micromonospora sp. U56]